MAQRSAPAAMGNGRPGRKDDRSEVPPTEPSAATAAADDAAPGAPRVASRIFEEATAATGIVIFLLLLGNLWFALRLWAN